MPFQGTTAVTMGEYLHVLRKRAGLSMADLAEKAGVHRNTVSLVERDLENCTIDTVSRLFAVFGLTLDVNFKHKEPAGEYCTCPVFLPHYIHAAPVCRSCGKPLPPTEDDRA